MIELSRIERVELREVWPHEARDFTPWLVENIDELGGVLGLDLEVRRREADVGSFSLDLLAHDVGNDRPVVIENQLDATNHDHLGKLLTYAAGYNANVAVWLVREFRPEHRAALDWLNERTDEHTAFFGVAVEVWKIGDSNPAPHFTLAAHPNDWQKQIAHPPGGAEGSPSEKQRRYQTFFQTLTDTLREEHQFTKAMKGPMQSYQHFGAGFSGLPLSAAFTRQGRARVEITCDRTDKRTNEDLFEQLLQRRAQIEDVLGYTLNWDRVDHRKACRIHVERDGRIEDDDDALDEIQAWMIDELLAFKRVFQPHLQDILG